jgi:hypothetical protein
MSGEAQCLGLQYAYSGASVAQTCQLGDAVIESGQLGKEPVQLLLDWRPPSSVSLNHNGLRLLHAVSLAYSVPEVRIFGVCLGTYSTEAPLDRPVNDFVCSGILPALITNQVVAFLAKSINLDLHPHQQFIGGLGCNARALEILNLFPVPHDLAAHVFDFGSDEIEVWHVLPCKMRERPTEQKENAKASRL